MVFGMGKGDGETLEALRININGGVRCRCLDRAVPLNRRSRVNPKR